MRSSPEVETAARRFNEARSALLNELDSCKRNDHRYSLLVLKLRRSIEAYLKALRNDRHETKQVFENETVE
jgi:hypothetical protein